MKVAIEGCCHGELKSIYASLPEQTDLLLICGDFQAIRNKSDLLSLAVPEKYRALGDFHMYYSGQLKASCLTIIIGGNHESSGYMWELYHGGFVAPNIYYLGHVGSVLVNGLRISGASGIYKSGDYGRGHWERIPYDRSSIRSCYHTRNYDIHKLSLLPPTPDIFLSHDWPLSIEQFGKTGQLIKNKPFFAAEIARNELGSPPLWELAKLLRPTYWFSAHLHVKFAALVDWQRLDSISNRTVEKQIISTEVSNSEEIQLDLGEFDSSRHEQLNSPRDKILDETLHDTRRKPCGSTKFLALDKCLPNRKFLQVITVEAPIEGETIMTFDPFWLAITRTMHSSLPLTKQMYQPRAGEVIMAELDEQKQWIVDNLPEGGAVRIDSIQHFIQTAPPHNLIGEGSFAQTWYTNPQTVAFCDWLSLPNKINMAPAKVIPGLTSADQKNISLPQTMPDTEIELDLT